MYLVLIQLIIAKLSEVLALGEDESNKMRLKFCKNNVSTDDLATIIYTSGTTGRPKE
jgi:long-chain acyl-CoA synthetase